MSNHSTASNESSLSKRFLQALKNRVPKGKLAEVLMQLLNFEKSGAYRRISGESSLSLEEMAILALYFQMSIDQFIFAETDKTVSTFPYMQRPIRSIGEFMDGIAGRVEEAAQIENVKIDFVSREIPLFQYFNFPELTAFKTYIWARTIWKLPQFQQQQFSLKQIRGIKRPQKNIVKYYNTVPGSEIWGMDGLSIPLSQIEYYLEQDMFINPEEALLLCEQLRALMRHVSEMTKYGKKFAPGEKPTADSPDYKLYHNQLAHSNSFILAASPQIKVSFVTMDNLHSATFTDPQFHRFMEDWRARLSEQSVLIDGASSSTHTKFFNQAYQQINRFEKRIKRLIEEHMDR